jgi:hypothetical protein
MTSIQVLLAYTLLFGASAGPSSSPQPAPSLDSVSWMAGHWVGTGTQDVSEEVWLPATAGAMVGVWRWASGGDMRLYELLTISIESGRIALRLRHFRPNLVALEDKENPFVLPLIKSGPREAVFEGIASDGGPLRITYRSPAPDTLEATVERGGTKQVYAYRLKK